VNRWSRETIGTGVPGPDDSPESPVDTRRPGRRRWITIFASCGGLVLVGGGLYAALTQSDSAVSTALVDRTNQPAPVFSLAGLLALDRTISSADLRGHDLVVNFWASWCVPCKTEMPLLESAYRAEHGRVTFLGVDTNDTRSAAVDFVAKVRVTYDLASDPHGVLASRFHLFGLPTTVFISPSGRVLGRHIGQMNATTLDAALREAFGAKVTI
jgi:cytochrome c biogenesis protein CcmG, thiol:disulfide interchange protein DsbE